MKVTNDMLGAVLMKGGMAKNTDLKSLVSSLKAGDSFKAEIVDMKADTVKLKFEDGSVLDAKSSGMLNVKIGQDTEFSVKESLNGKIIVELAKNDDAAAKDILRAAEFPVTKENINIINEMIKNNCPIDKTNIEKAMFFYHGDDKPNIDKAIYLTKENMPQDMKFLKAFDRLNDTAKGMKSDITEIAEEITAMDEGNEKDEILKAIGIEDKNYSHKELFKKIEEKLFIDLDKGENIDKISEKFDNIEKLIKVIKKLDENEYSLLKEKADNIENNTEFMKNTDNRQLYQIPVIIDGNRENGELYILKDKKKKNKDYSKNASVFISMDYAYLGRVDTMINKEEKNLGLQFTLENEDTLKLIKQNYHKLEEMLKEKGYSIRNIGFDTDKDRKNIIQVFKEENDGDKRFCFDLRV